MEPLKLGVARVVIIEQQIDNLLIDHIIIAALFFCYFNEIDHCQKGAEACSLRK